MALVLGTPMQLGDHLQRELGRDVDHEVDLATLGDHLVEHAVGELADVRLELADHAEA